MNFLEISPNDAAERGIESGDLLSIESDNVIDQLGTIAKSGTAEFLSKLSGDERADAALIGQFGVGFYSAFVVANRVELLTRRAGLPVGEGVRWESEGEGDFVVETIEKAERGLLDRSSLRLKSTR